ncbi:MAG: hypothetical protein ACD_29C00134G0002 [uncultured bacterium]|nr:MAG: hypothetical protein ACD_29C00134G0002 [uncultured bacterium]
MKKIKSGVILPDCEIKGDSIYTLLSETHWTLIVCGKEKIKIQHKQLKICHVPENTYSTRYILIKPDRHIALAENEMSNETILQQLL